MNNVDNTMEETTITEEITIPIQNTPVFKTPEEMRKFILGYKDLPTQEVKVPEWGGIVIYIRSMTAGERDLFETSQMASVEIKEGEDKGKIQKVLSLENLRAAILARTICSDPEGKIRIFSEDDITALGCKSAAALDRCVMVSHKLNGMSREDEENLIKNSESQEDVSG